jgi:serine/threonine protein kinase
MTKEVGKRIKPTSIMPGILLEGMNGKYHFDPSDPKTLIGEGGMGRVFKGIDTNTGKPVAIKVLYRELTNNSDFVERARREASIRIRHKNLVEMLDFVEKNGIYHDISEFLEGETLQKKIESLKTTGKVFSQFEAKKIILEICNGLEELHNRNFIHRDVDPSNIMISNDGSVKLFDFGVVKKTDSVNKNHTAVGVQVGKTQYSSPEQIRNQDPRDIGPACDIYALGITLYEMLTGELPFDGATEYEILKKKNESLLPHNSKFSDQYYNFLLNSTSANTNFRYSNINQFRTDLLKLPQGKIVRLKKPLLKGISTKRKFVISGLLLLLVGLFATSYFWYMNNKFVYYKAIADEYSYLAKYDSAKIFYSRSLEYNKDKATLDKLKMLSVLAEARNLYSKSRFKEAFSKLSIAANLRSGEAYYYMGELTSLGLGTVRNEKKSAEYFQKAADLDFKMAYWKLALIYANGTSVKKDKRLSDKYLGDCIEPVKKRAQVNDPEALSILGDMYSTGSGVPKDPIKTLEYYIKSADAGSVFTQNKLASMYQYGIGVNKDLALAVKWYEMSANNGYAASQLDLGNLYLNGVGVKKDINKGLYLISLAAAQNYPPALFRMAFIYLNGILVKKDSSKYFDFIERALSYDIENITYIETLAFANWMGIGKREDFKQAEYYYLKAIGIDSSRATSNFYYLGQLYKTGGIGIEKSLDKSLDYFKKAHLHKNKEAAYQIGELYYQEAVKIKDPQRFETQKKYFQFAKQWFQKSAQSGNVEAKRILILLDNLQQI